MDGTEKTRRVTRILSHSSNQQVGLYDTQGNVFEWIWERFGDYELRTITDPFHFEVPLVEVYTRPIKGGLT